VFLAYLLVGEDRAWLFTSPSRFSGQLLESVSQDMAVLPYEAVFETLASTLKRGDRLYISPERTNTRIAAAIPAGVEIVEGRDFTTDMKAAKNPVELEGYDELTIAQELADQRARSKEYLGPSFGPIAGFREHGAMCHYSATDESSLKIEGDGLLVLDTGGMYESGMTDVTRTLLFGTATDEQRRDYTLVLKGNLALASQRFPEGTCGYQLAFLPPVPVADGNDVLSWNRTWDRISAERP
jgi:Xaa-Pro aminopeptidase